MPVGIKVTLRGNGMWEFLLRLIAIALPNIRDFRGVPTKLDGNGNYTLGITDHSIFPEINVERQRVNTGMDICIVTTANSDEEATELLKTFGNALQNTFFFIKQRASCSLTSLSIMAKKSVIHRNKKRERLVSRFAAKRAELKKILENPETSEEDFYIAQAKLAKLPRNSSAVRLVIVAR